MATTPICSTEFDPNFPDYFPSTSTSTSTSQNFVYPESSTKLKTTSKSKPRKNKRSGKLRNKRRKLVCIEGDLFHIFLLRLSTPFKLLRLTMTMDGEMGVKQLCLLLTINDIFMSTDGYCPAVLPSLLLIDHRFSFR